MGLADQEDTEKMREPLRFYDFMEVPNPQQPPIDKGDSLKYKKT